MPPRRYRSAPCNAPDPRRPSDSRCGRPLCRANSPCAYATASRGAAANVRINLKIRKNHRNPATNANEVAAACCMILYK